MSLQKTVFGRLKVKPNTFIGGVSGTINTAALVATKLGISSTRIKGFSIIGSNIQFEVNGGTYSMPTNAFKSTAITYFNDANGLVYTTINVAAFYGCTALTSVIFPEVTIITSSNAGGVNGTFQGCINLVTVTIPKFANDASNKDFLFYGCSSLVTVNFPLYNGKIGTNMFTNCTSLTTINLSITGTVGADSFVGTKITTINLSNATSIGNNAFSGVTTLAGAITGNSITTVGTNVFKSTKITSFSSTSCTFLDVAAFWGCTFLTTVYLPALTTVTSNNAGGGNGTFQGCTALTSFYAPNLTYNATAKSNLFYGCSALTTLSFPLWNGPIEAGMFGLCSSLSSITITINGSIGIGAFSGSVITSIDLTNVTSIGNSAFAGITALVGSLVGNSITTIGTNTFQNTRITGFSSSTCTSIGVTAFNGCISLVTASFPALITLNSTSAGGGSGTFQNCTSMTTFSAPLCTTVTSGYAFAGCTAITSIDLSSVTTLGASVSVSNNMFLNIKTGCTITVPVAMQTINSGAPHADLAYAVASRGATIVYV